MRKFIIWVILILTPLSASAGEAFEDFPLLPDGISNSNWYVAQEAYAPVSNLFYAIQERAIAACADPIEYIEEVFVGAVVTNNPGVEATLYYWPDYPGWDWGGGVVYDGPVDGAYLISIPDYYDHEWVVPDSAVYDETYDEWALTFICEPPSQYEEDIYITITNTFGTFEFELEGTNFSGVVPVTRGLLDAMWDKIYEITPLYVFPGNRTNTWEEWWESPQCMEYVTKRLGSNSPSIYELSDEWTMQPVVPQLSLPYAFNEGGDYRAILRTEENRWGRITGGEVAHLPVSSTNYFSAAIELVAASWGVTNAINVSTSSVPEWEYAWGWKARIDRPYKHNIDFLAYLTETNREPEAHMPEWVYTGARTSNVPMIPLNLVGTVAVLELSNSVITNILVSGYTGYSTLDSAELVGEVITNVYTSVVHSARSETIAADAQSTNIWYRIDSVILPDLATNVESFALVWNVDRWSDARENLFAEELDRMYYAIREMRWTMPFSGIRNKMTYRPNARNSTNSVEQFTLGSPSSNPHDVFTGTRYWKYPATPQDGLRYLWGQFDLGHEMQPEEVQYMLDPGSEYGVTNNSAYFDLDFPFQGIPSSWEADLIMTNIPYLGPVAVGITNVIRPPVYSTLSPTVTDAARASYATNIVANSLYLPYARAGRLREPFFSNPKDDYPQNMPQRMYPVMNARTTAAVYGEHYASGNFGVDVTLPDHVPHTAALYYGDFSLFWDSANVQVLPLWTGERTAGWKEGALDVPNKTWGGFPPTEWSLYAGPEEYDGGAFTAAEMPWDGNGIIPVGSYWKMQKQQLEEWIDSYETNMTSFVMGTTNEFPTSPGEPVLHIPYDTEENNPGVGVPTYWGDRRWRGWDCTHMYLIIDWDFDYK